MKYGRLNPPESLEETPELIGLEDSYDEDFNLFPEGGFIRDYYYYTLGWGANSFYTFWTSIAGLSGLASRDVRLRSAMRLFPNFYVIIVGPPGLGYKSTSMDEWEKIENTMWSCIPEHLAERKKVPIIRSKATPEFLFSNMKNKPLEHSDGEMSDAVLKIRASELDNLLNKAQYNSGLISKLTDFYDCKEWDTDGVLGRNNGKLQEIQRVYASMLGCTTPDALKATLPDEAFGGGFVSRATICNADVDQATRRSIDWPFYPETVPDNQEMAERMAWLTTYKNGEYSLTKDAMAFYRKWFKDVRETIIEKARQGDSDDRDNRVTTQALKLAMLLSYQRYDLDRRITVEDMWMAANIIDQTIKRATAVLDDVAVTASPDKYIRKFYHFVKSYPDGVDSRTICRKMHIKMAKVNELYDQLKNEGRMEMKIVRVSEGAKGRSINQKIYKIIEDSGERAD